ncbi:ATP-binding protein [uncultured Fibrobacter sp.]|uniref:ATP-binding protein n=1 Tax=uncultured Fibrobacter sp. TaxID=261512 RepID=UPI002803BD2D|nr:ATP-binding protein [uncultured Fibrobacter sp.]
MRTLYDILLQDKDFYEIPDSICADTSVTNPTAFLNWLSSATDKKINIGDFRVLQPWMLTAIAALSRRELERRIYPICEQGRSTAKFANELGLTRIINSDADATNQEFGRTVKLHRINDYAKIENLADRIAKLAIDEDCGSNEYFDANETEFTLKYILIELLRNVIQHSADLHGGVVVAQRMDQGNDYIQEKAIQICVVDNGCGIFNSLKTMHPDITDNKIALERALWPSLSGRFPKGDSGSSQNAGMGLFVISELVKRLAGRMLIVSGDNALLLEGSLEESNKIKFLDCKFNGTLIVVDIPKRSVADFEELFTRIRETAIERSISKRKISFIKFDNIPENILKIKLHVANENTVDAEEYSKKYLIPLIEKGTKLCLDFSGFKITTQSFLHAILFNTLKLAYAKNVQIYAINLTPAVKDCILLLEWYTLGTDLQK